MAARQSTATAACVLALSLAALGGSVAPAQAETRYAGQLAAGPQTATCATQLPSFGISFESGLYAPNGSMTVARNSGVCALNVTFFYGRPSSLVVVEAPQHGSVTLGAIKRGSSLGYRPADGYTGPDRFSVRAAVGGRQWTIPVAVTVTG